MQTNDAATIDVLVKTMRLEAEGALSFELITPSGAALPGFEPGAHIDVHLPNSMTRQYSLTNESGDGFYSICVGLDRASRGGSKQLHHATRVGDVLRISKPRNTFSLDLRHESYLLIAGGIGVTPILAIARALEHAGKDWTMVYAARSRAAAVFVQELSGYGDRCRFHFDDEEGGPCNVVEIVAMAAPNAHVYACGPTPMLEALAEIEALPTDRLHTEYFAPPPTLAHGDVFVVEAVRSGVSVEVPADRSILEVLVEHGVDAPSSCRQGICGTCETRVLEGAPDHRDQILSDAEKAAGDTMMICCSRALTPRLRLDI